MTVDRATGGQDRPVLEGMPQTRPDDAHNRELVQQVRPSDWQNPLPEGRYNLVVIGAGTAGLVTAVGAASLGAKVALVERGLLGGDCLNVGCVPSKAVISAARMAAAVRDARSFGVQLPEAPTVDFAAVMQRMRQLRAKISHHDAAARFANLGIDVHFGQASFVDSETLDVDGSRLKFAKAVIATGARAAAPPIDGLNRVNYLTNETVFSLTQLPRRFAVIGAGPIGCELAQAFAQLGSQVSLIESKHGVLPHEDREAADIVRQAMSADGVDLVCCGRQLKLEQRSDAGSDCISLRVDSHDRHVDIEVDALLVAVGRAANVQGMNLDAVGVRYDDNGVEVNDQLQTTNPKIFAAGDVCSPYKFTHAADFMARMVIQNALFGSVPFAGAKKFSDLVIPWATYTTPELARVGIHQQQADEQGIAIDTYTQPFAEVDRAILAGRTEGFVRVHTKRGSDQILGATIVGHGAGEMIATITMAMTHGLGLSKIGSTIHPYPTESEAIRKLGDQYSRTRLTPLIKQGFEKWLRWSRR